MTDSAVSIGALAAECGRIEGEIAGHRAAVAGLVAERDALVGALRGLGLSERAVGRLLGISGVRVHQIVSAPAEPLSAKPPEASAQVPQRSAKPAVDGAKVPRRRAKPVNSAKAVIAGVKPPEQMRAPAVDGALALVPLPAADDLAEPVTEPAGPVAVAGTAEGRKAGPYPCCKHCKVQHPRGHADPCTQGCAS